MNLALWVSAFCLGIPLTYGAAVAAHWVWQHPKQFIKDVRYYAPLVMVLMVIAGFFTGIGGLIERHDQQQLQQAQTSCSKQYQPDTDTYDACVESKNH